MSYGVLMQLPKLLGISGSLRGQSYSTAILEALVSPVREIAQLTVVRLNDIPLYNQDVDTATPPLGVAALRSAIGAAEGIILATPEYNYGVSGVLKNALDWASRPYGHSALIGKPVLTVSSSPASTGGVRAQTQLNETLIAVAARLVLRPQIVIARVHEKLQGGGFTDTATLDFLLSGINDLLAEISRPASNPIQES
jgi:chromate reductase